MKAFQKRPVAAVIMVVAIVASIFIGKSRMPDTGIEPSTTVKGSYTYCYDESGVLSKNTKTYIDEINQSLFAQTGAQILVQVVDTTGGSYAVDYAYELGGRYGVGSAERDNGLVLVLALDDLSESGLQGDYGLAIGDGLFDYEQQLYDVMYAYLEDDFAAGDYDDGVRNTVEAFVNWLGDYYGADIRPGYVPPVRETYTSSAGGYYTESVGYYETPISDLALQLTMLVIVLAIIWAAVDAVRWNRYRRRYIVPGVPYPTRRYYPVFWGRHYYSRPPRPRSSYSYHTTRTNYGGRGGSSFGGGSFSRGSSSHSSGGRSSFGGSFSSRSSYSSGRSSSRSSFGGGSFSRGSSSRSGGGRSSFHSSSHRSSGGSRGGRR